MTVSFLSPAPKHAMVEDVAERLRQAILAGHFHPGQRLREEQLAQMLDVSRGPIREALARLQREGLVLIRHHRGATVARLSQQDAEEVYSLRLALERLAVQRTVRLATPEDFAAMESVLVRMTEATEHGISAQEAAELDTQFHSLLYAAAHHSRLQECWATLQPQIYVFLLSRKVDSPDLPKITVTIHTALLEALRARDEQASIQIIEKHLRDSYLRVARSYEPSDREDPSPEHML